MEEEATLKLMTGFLTTKWKQPYSMTYVYIKSRVAITLVRATHC